MVIYNLSPSLPWFPPRPRRPDVWVEQTGFNQRLWCLRCVRPLKRFGIVVLANKNYPNEGEVEIAHRIFEALSR